VTVLAGAVGIGLFYAGINDRSSNPLLSDFGSLPPGPYPRISALFLNPNMLCTFLVVSFLLALGMRAARWLDGVRFWLLTIGIVITAASTISAGLGGLVLGGGLWAWMRLRGSRHTGLRPIILVGSHAVALVFFLATAVSPVTRDGQGVVVPILHRRIEPSSRVLAWRTAFETVKEHPVLGRGLGLEVSSAHYLNASGRWEYVTDAHNVWLSVAGQTGVVGLLAFGTIILYLVRGLAPLDPRGAPGLVMKTSVALAFVGAFLYQSLSGSFEDTRHLWVLIGMLAAARRGWDGA
jgi:O-antigen ligase